MELDSFIWGERMCVDFGVMILRPGLPSSEGTDPPKCSFNSVYGYSISPGLHP